MPHRTLPCSDRVRNELFAGQEGKGAHRTGSEGAAAVILGYAAAAYAVYALNPGPLSGFLLGLGGAWIGLTVQHCGNHGAMSTKAWVNNAMGLCDDLIGGSSLAWRYHHQVSHHIHCNGARAWLGWAGLGWRRGRGRYLLPSEFTLGGCTAPQRRCQLPA